MKHADWIDRSCRTIFLGKEKEKKKKMFVYHLLCCPVSLSFFLSFIFVLLFFILSLFFFSFLFFSFLFFSFLFFSFLFFFNEFNPSEITFLFFIFSNVF